MGNLEINKKVISPTGEELDLVYREDDPFKNMEGRVMREARGVCFTGDKLVIVREPGKGSWSLPGGKVEIGENFRQATIREVKEEASMDVKHQEVIGYQDIDRPGQVSPRYVYSLCIVKQTENPTIDPDDDIAEVRLIDPKDAKEYLGLDDIGERIIARAIELKRKIN